MNLDRAREWVESFGLSDPVTEWVWVALQLVALVLIAVIVNFVAKRIVLQVVRRVVERSNIEWDDVFLKQQVFDRLSHLAPALVFHVAAPRVFADHETVAGAVQSGALIYMVVVGIWTASSFLNALSEIYERTERSRHLPLTAFMQVIKLVLFILGFIFVLSQLLGKSPVVFFSGLGAFTAVLILVFKDSILGLVAGVQLSVNDMVAKGDWISMPKYGADGDVLEVSLTTVKVQNWDKTISTIPTYALISDSFKNWRGMDESGGRRIKRSLPIDLRSIRFCDDEMIAKFKKIESIREYVESKTEEIQSFNQEHDVEESLINGRRLTNVGTFRAYVEAYLKNHPKIHQDMTFLVRQLPPTEKGLPLEIYVFSSDQAWAKYEGIQADIFDHLLAAVPEFGLRLFQSPSGEDVAMLARDGAAE
ncbi:MAG: mechanosensitive ion channel [Gemmatimonadetes bacterium]|nr:mechanosensitive ion channel [Gemmatimonadota bacterium]